ncbi:hypothetical protein JI721_15075 [Alicyclobacillus cycloheptanicus]|uniref:Uncharacterized protein n=1 Tax=Alicyclobacillus cycloheptanicus TaxID=1457 RepID=A0ABT9XD84_9BACL|nr:hypothetical protein [Alicyclobacillus cycloheptanicus]MDQ0188259.1 hypothetical protein [Alicyclobacillus cycloheptanicus]WDM00980.1 hypothetical protein JI721_15075 [Alicyclobacillus cycloheptanicus]
MSTVQLSKIVEAVHEASNGYRRSEIKLLQQLIGLQKGTSTLDNAIEAVIQMNAILAETAYHMGMVNTERQRLTFVLQAKPLNLEPEQIKSTLHDSLIECMDRNVKPSQLVTQYRLTATQKARNAAQASIAEYHRQAQHVAKIAPFTRATSLIIKHEEEFHRYASTLDEQLQTACRMFKDGHSVNDVVQTLGIQDEKTLLQTLQKAFIPFFESIGA